MERKNFATQRHFSNCSSTRNKGLDAEKFVTVMENKELKPEFTVMLHQPHTSSLSAFSHVPVDRKIPKHLSYFYQKNKEEHISAYDSIFKRPHSYNEKLHRDDRKYAKHNSLDLYTEEAARPVPVLSSSEYGRYLQRNVDNVNREHVRIGLVRMDFYRKNGISKSLEEGYGHVAPS
ncbi:cilia- and flagella-associated protein 90 [Hyla sarda]|uniref:cilia- and flagella-associated protein 90 n=1 Tax=Hyla sarda TaxID=327740 RepID=UPI0024C276DF|nr:cilia- and flagella-associated protein 90 [Hyla sarda]